MNRSSPPLAASESLERYHADIARHRMLSAEEEQVLARAYRRTGDVAHAHRLVTANLRFVVKIAREYRSYGVRLADLVQEGNIGLVKAVQRFDPDKGVRLISYAVWWIRAYIQDHILKSFSLVKIGTTHAQRKLFFALARVKRDLDHASVEHGSESDGEDPVRIGKELGVKPGEVLEMTRRLTHDVSLDARAGEDGGSSVVDTLVDGEPANDDELAAAEEQHLLRVGVAAAVAQLDPRERHIVEQRVMSEPPTSLVEISEHLGISRERARQLEVRATGKLRKTLHALALHLDLPMVGAVAKLDRKGGAARFKRRVAA
jgi:RNA polymerase sigma-32 factor